MRISLIFRLNIALFLIFFQLNPIGSYNNQIKEIVSSSTFDSTGVVLIDTITLEGYLVDYIKYTFQNKNMGNYSLCEFLFFDSIDIVSNNEKIKKENGYYFFYNTNFSFFLKKYKESELNLKIKTYRPFYKLNSDSMQPNPEEIGRYFVVKQKEEIIISKIYKSRFQRFKVSFQLIKKVSPLLDVPSSLISDGWLWVIVPL